MRLNYLQFWTIVACVLIIILASAFFFWGYKVTGSDKMALINNYTDSLFITKYKPVVENVSVDKASNTANSKVEVNKPATITSLPEEKKKPAIQQDRKSEESNEDQSVSEDSQANDGGNVYSLTSNEIQSLFSGNTNTPDETKTSDNPVQTHTQTTTQTQTTGIKAFNDYAQKFRRPLTDEDCANQHGKVILLFKVNERGHPVDIHVLRSLCQAADKEAVRLLQNGPTWAANNTDFTRLEVNF